MTTKELTAGPPLQDDINQRFARFQAAGGKSGDFLDLCSEAGIESSVVNNQDGSRSVKFGEVTWKQLDKVDQQIDKMEGKTSDPVADQGDLPLFIGLCEEAEEVGLGQEWVHTKLLELGAEFTPLEGQPKELEGVGFASAKIPESTLGTFREWLDAEHRDRLKKSKIPKKAFDAGFGIENLARFRVRPDMIEPNWVRHQIGRWAEDKGISEERVNQLHDLIVNTESSELRGADRLDWRVLFELYSRLSTVDKTVGEKIASVEKQFEAEVTVKKVDPDAPADPDSIDMSHVEGVVEAPPAAVEAFICQHTECSAVAVVKVGAKEIALCAKHADHADYKKYRKRVNIADAPEPESTVAEIAEAEEVPFSDKPEGNANDSQFSDEYLAEEAEKVEAGLKPVEPEAEDPFTGNQSNEALSPPKKPEKARTVADITELPVVNCKTGEVKTLGEVGYILAQKKREIADIKEAAKREVAVVEKEIDGLRFLYGLSMIRHLDEQLPRKADGEFKKKFLPTNRFRLKAKQTGGVRIADKDALKAFIDDQEEAMFTVFGIKEEVVRTYDTKVVKELAASGLPVDGVVNEQINPLGDWDIEVKDND